MLLLPTLNRPKILATCLQSALDTGATEECMILIDQDDWKTNLSAYGELKKPMGWSFKITTGVTMAEKVAEVYDAFWQTLGIINDDFEFVTEEWDKKLLKYLDGKTFVSSNDRMQRSFIKPSGVTVWNIALLEALGWKSFFPPGLQHLFVDDVWLQLGSATGTWRLAADVIVLHNHVLDGKMEQDATFHKTYDDFFAGTSRDKSVFDLYMKHDFGKDVQKIMAFQDYLPGEQQNPKVYSK